MDRGGGKRGDLVGRRRRYLAERVLGLGHCVLCGLVALFWALVGGALLWLIVRGAVGGDIGRLIVWAAFLGSLGISTVAGALLVRSVRLSRSLEVVPPVREQVADLPAAEVLVRGAAEPGESGKDLLRGSGAGETAGGSHPAVLRGRNAKKMRG